MSTVSFKLQNISNEFLCPASVLNLRLWQGQTLRRWLVKRGEFMLIIFFAYRIDLQIQTYPWNTCVFETSIIFKGVFLPYLALTKCGIDMQFMLGSRKRDNFFHACIFLWKLVQVIEYNIIWLMCNFFQSYSEMHHNKSTWKQLILNFLFLLLNKIMMFKNKAIFLWQHTC